MSEKIEKMCREFIEIMKQEYKIDCLELGRNAAAKFGRNNNIDWNEVVVNSDIKVNVKVKVTNQGRGDY